MNCAILFGTPVERMQFDSATRNGPSDYIRGMLRGRFPDLVWAEDYAHVAQAAQRLITTARKLDVGVYEQATLNDLHMATQLFKYVIVFAHWRGIIFRQTDFVADFQVISERLNRHPELQKITLGNKTTEDLVNAFNGAMEDGQQLLETLPPSLAEAGRRSRVIGQTLCRDLIDEALAGLVNPGNRLELFDGLHTPDEVEASIWPDFTGELDFGLCNSAALATFLDLRRGNRISHLHWPDYLLPGPQFVKVETTLKQMAIRGGGYIQARLMVEEAEPNYQRR